MKLRLIIQPLVACFLAVLAARRDVREGNPPFLWALAFRSEHRRKLLGQGWKDTAKSFGAAVAVDVVYQLVELRAVYFGEAIAVALILAIVPYALTRGLVTRLARKRKDPP